MSSTKKVAVIGAGLAGSDCAWVLAEGYGLEVTLFEMKGKSPTPAQATPHLFAELVCSNSLKSTSRLNPAGLLKEEIASLGSLVMKSALEARVPAGESLAVDRDLVSGAITRCLRTHPRISVVEDVVESIAALDARGFDAIVVATGPLTHDSLAEDLRRLTGSASLYFYDAIAPVIDGDTIDMDIAFFANRATRTRAFEKRSGVDAHLFAEEAAEEGAEEGADETPEGDYLYLPLDKEH
jgi:methylenetetrahydrofolate--tRNA-(uracil-5-)-methyltransferase